jgi:hypothetical protein
MPIAINGRDLGVPVNGVFTSQNTAAIPGGRLWPEAATTWIAMRAAFIAGGGNPAHFQPGGPASSARTLVQQRGFFANQPPPAAVPGTSNHGWGLAVDCPWAEAQAWLLRHGPDYGWAHDEGLRVGEPWHFRYIGASTALLRRLTDPLAGYTAAERSWIRESDQLKRTGQNPARLADLVAEMTAQRKRIWVVAQPRPRGDGHGWTPLRLRRYASLLARTT